MSNFEIYAEKLRANGNNLMELIGSPQFFMGGYIALPNEIVIYDEAEAIEYATDQDIDLNKGIEYQYWVGIQEMNDRGNASHEKRKDLKLGKEFTRLLESISTEHTNALSQKGREVKIASPLVDWACGDFYLFLLNMTIFESQSEFHQSLYNVYKNGGIPCGWKGDFPDGELLVYSKQPKQA
jgi:hypothetical protein